MDCEKFETALMDELYGELDELTSAAVKRHASGCARCTALLGGLRATRRVAAVPMVEAPAGLEERILLAVRDAQKVVPMRRRAAGFLSTAGTWAMRPQTAMAALFLVMIGTSVLFIRGKPSRAPSADVTITEQGAPAPVAVATATAQAQPGYPAASAAVVTRPPEAKPSTTIAANDIPNEDGRGLFYKGGAPGKDKDDDSLGGMANASPPAGAPNMLPPAPPANGGAGFGASGALAQSEATKTAGPTLPMAGEKQANLSPFDTALQSYRAGRFDDAARSFDTLAPADANAELWAARAVRESKGCRNALARFDKVARRAAGSPPGWDALLEGALCYRAVGDFGQARVRLTELLKVDSHKDRAQTELDRLNQVAQAQGAAAPPAAAARPAPKRAAPEATAAPKAADQAF
jgi:hypothetical protein